MAEKGGRVFITPERLKIAELLHPTLDDASWNDIAGRLTADEIKRGREMMATKGENPLPVVRGGYNGGYDPLEEEDYGDD